MPRLLLVANPAASGFTATLHREVLQGLRARFEVTPIWPGGPAEAEAAAAAAAADGIEVVAAMGGDGIVHRVANGIAGTAAALAVIPAGTSNVFARLTGYPRRGAAAAVAVARSSRISSLATLRLAATGPEGTIDRVAVFAAGVGYDAAVIRESEKAPLAKVGAGTIHYTRSALRVALSAYRNRAPDLTVTVDGDTRRAVTAIAQIHDRFTFLGRRSLTLSPAGGPAALALEEATATKILRVVTQALRHRSTTGVPGVTVWQPFRRLETAADTTGALEADGEYLGEVHRVAMTVVGDSLRLIDPR